MQKIHSANTQHARYFWNVTIEGQGTSEYRSRHAKATAVKKQLIKKGLTVLSVKTVKA